MRVNLLPALFNWAIGFSTRWLIRITQIETPSVRYVRRLRTQPVRSTNGPTALKGKKSMGRILDPDWRQFDYVPAAKTDLRVSMEKYKEKVLAENQRLRSEPETSGDSRGHHGQVSSEPNNGLQRHKLVGIRGKG